ncbi:MAG: GNAT family N-acetyltransferase [Angelakisella sp.]|nr:GNAT family N-acetyltransferase [Angelakisella sp.]
MLSIETSRLRVFPLPLAQLRLWAEDLPALERSLGYAYRGVPVEKALGDARRLLAAAEEAGESPYRTVWMLVQREEGVIIGSAGFKGGPDEKGEVEIRYAMGKDYRRRGYMTEAVKAICCWALEQPEVAHITAETDLVSYPSQRILERLGFQKYREEETLWWRL